MCMCVFSFSQGPIVEYKMLSVVHSGGLSKFKELCHIQHYSWVMAQIWSTTRNSLWLDSYSCVILYPTKLYSWVLLYNIQDKYGWSTKELPVFFVLQRVTCHTGLSTTCVSCPYIHTCHILQFTVGSAYILQSTKYMIICPCNLLFYIHKQEINQECIGHCPLPFCPLPTKGISRVKI